MASHGFSYVPDKGYIRLESQLDEGEWGKIVIPAAAPAAAPPQPPTLLTLPLLASRRRCLIGAPSSCGSGN